MNENFEKYIKDLSPELQEKAKGIKTEEELNAFLAENELELPEEALELVSGGCGKKPKCPKCGSSNYQIAGAIYHCDDCGYERHDRFVR
ncbi:MAG: hypothetical protein J6O40_05855 [Ruminococcus sp.]|nr:hypothetical protein [Ruminococcus sp.]